MHCSTCGAALSTGLNYCNRCGKDLTSGSKQSAEQIESLIWAIVGVTVGGISVIIGLMAVMKEVVGFNTGLIAAITLLSFFLILVADIVFIWILLQRNRADGKAKTNTQIKEASTQKLIEMPSARALTDAMPPTVTEHTTRNLEPVHREKVKSEK